MTTILLTMLAGSGAPQLVLTAPADPSCSVSDVSRLLWTMIAAASVAGLLAVLRPSWRWVAGLAAAALVWTWVDMEGPVLFTRGSHGLHLADVPVLICGVAVVVVVVRLLRRRSPRPADART